MGLKCQQGKQFPCNLNWGIHGCGSEQDIMDWGLDMYEKLELAGLGSSQVTKLEEISSEPSST